MVYLRAATAGVPDLRPDHSGDPMLGSAMVLTAGFGAAVTVLAVGWLDDGGIVIPIGLFGVGLAIFGALLKVAFALGGAQSEAKNLNKSVQSLQAALEKDRQERKAELVQVRQWAGVMFDKLGVRLAEMERWSERVKGQAEGRAEGG